ncbi:MAG: IS21 family transposase [Candidatus Nanopelagicales bacterium]
MLFMDFIAEIRRRHFISGESISSIALSLNLSRTTVRKHLKTIEEPVYQRKNQSFPKLGEFQERLKQWLETESSLPKKQRRTAQRLFEGLQTEGYRGAYDSVQRFVKHWKSEQKKIPAATKAFIPLAFPPGETCQFDWSEEFVELGGIGKKIKVGHFRLCYSRKMFVVAYPCETQEMVLDAHNRAFMFFHGVPLRMVYDNPKTIVDTVFVGKERKFNRRFLTLANHYLFEPVACTPAAGWEKGQIENQVGNVREWLFTPRARFADFNELNAWLEQRCEELAGRQHPSQTTRTITECFSEEQPLLRPITAQFDGYVEHLLRVSSTCLVRLDRNHYSVPAVWVGQFVSVRVTADRLCIVADGDIIAEHARCFSRDKFIFNPWHYLPVLERKPGALRHGAPFQDWDLPVSIQVVRDRLMKQPKGDKAFVDLLLMAKEAGLEAMEIACELTLETGIINASVVVNELRRLLEPPRAKTLTTADSLSLRVEPTSDCSRYECLLGGRYVH